MLFYLSCFLFLHACDISHQAEVIYDNVDPAANIIFGALVDERMQGEMSITVLATGFQTEEDMERENQHRVSGLFCTHHHTHTHVGYITSFHVLNNGAMLNRRVECVLSVSIVSIYCRVLIILLQCVGLKAVVTNRQTVCVYGF